MRLPDWLKTKRHRRQGQTLVAELELDTSAFLADLADFARAQQHMADGASLARQSLEAMREALRRLAAPFELDPVRRAGLEARYYIRGGMDPRLSTPDARDTYARLLLQNRTGDPLMMLLGPGDRAALAAAFLRGWVDGHPEPVCSCQVTPERFHFVYYGATEPGSMWEWDPDCPVHLASSGVR